MSAGDWKEMLVAVQTGDLDLVKYHIGHGINPNYQHPELLTTPLMESISFGHIEIAEYLLAQGADPTLVAGFGAEGPLDLAKKSKNKDMVRLIRSHLPKRRGILGRFFSRRS